MAQNWSSFKLKMAIKAELSAIYNAWTQSAEIEKWFLESCSYESPDGQSIQRDSNVEFDAKYSWTWFLYDEIEKGRITAANGQDYFQFTFAGDCLVDVRLETIDDHTVVHLEQHNIPEDEESKFNIRMGCMQGWTFYLLNLKSFYETGYDLRNKNPKFKGINN